MPGVLSHSLLDGQLCLHLLPRSAYSARDPLQWQTLGMTLERQQGVHAIGSDRRVDFDTLPGVLAQTPAGVEVFSESAEGGEYLALRLAPALVEQCLPVLDRRVQQEGHRRGLKLAQTLRRLMLDPHPDGLAIEQCALGFVALGRSVKADGGGAVSDAFLRVLERIAGEFDQPLTLAQLAQTYGENELRLLRDFSRFMGVTPHAYLVEVRLQAARRLIEGSDRALAQIALEVGFAHQSHMGSAMRRQLGMTPGGYRLRF
ncbi:AraC family transcriptional regulator [Pseudomonas sp. B2M1-30]|uniref:helix-turn-helix domain-containing protein n=1 Tax=Pseudomonas TaxID=286 RepID=UPI0021C70A90|nr:MULTISPECIES: AraC family transcriptional regulator [Pseudomonas]MCU0121836.1 AraC family transcriptional regulator [Pseudomonas sp. B2M1-30]MCU7264472.1 AraC family transcriptional regulator [Pseudomonas koreensis]